MKKWKSIMLAGIMALSAMTAPITAKAESADDIDLKEYLELKTQDIRNGQTQFCNISDDVNLGVFTAVETGIQYNLQKKKSLADFLELTGYTLEGKTAFHKAIDSTFAYCDYRLKAEPYKIHKTDTGEVVSTLTRYVYVRLELNGELVKDKLEDSLMDQYIVTGVRSDATLNIKNEALIPMAFSYYGGITNGKTEDEINEILGTEGVVTYDAMEDFKEIIISMQQLGLGDSALKAYILANAAGAQQKCALNKHCVFKNSSYTMIIHYNNGNSVDVCVYPTTFIPGDASDDHVFDTLDIVALQKYILGIGTLSNYAQSDVNQDGEVDVYDLALMKRQLLNQK